MPEKTFRCFPEDAALFRQVIKAWPELDATVRGLQVQGMFPGLRAVQITLQGDEKTRCSSLSHPGWLQLGAALARALARCSSLSHPGWLQCQ